MEQRPVPGTLPPDAGHPAPDTDSISAEPPVIRRSPLQRLGCGLLLLIWLVFLLIPGALFVLAVQGEIVLWHGGDVPDPDAHPLLQVKLLTEIDTRGLSFTTSTVQTGPEDTTCLQTRVRFLLWQGEGENVSYCDCYQRQDVGDETPLSFWQSIGTTSGDCGDTGG